MPSGARANGRSSHPSERTPLLQSTSDCQENHVQSVEIAIHGEGSVHQSPDLGKTRSHHPHVQLALPDDDDDDDTAPRAELENLVRFQNNGKLEGVGKWKFRCVFGGILLGYFIAMFDSTLMASSHPVITSYFHASNSASWLSTAFLLTSTSLQPLMGRLSDTFGRRLLYLTGLVLLAATTAWCALAQSVGSFIAARAFCGIGAAGVLSMGNVMTNDLVSIEIRGTYQAYINLFYGGGSACGAAFGGYLCDKLGWRMTFAIQIPILLVLLLNAIFTTPSSLGPNLAKRSGLGIRDSMKGFDVAGSFLLASSVAFLILGLNLGGNIYPWKHPIVIASLIVAVISGAILIRVESGAARAVMPLPMLFSKPRGNLVFNNFFAQIGMNTILFNAPLYFQAVKLESASVSGFRLAGPSVALTICGVSAGFIMTATGRMKWLIAVGSLSMLVGATCLSSMWDDIPTWLATMFLVPSSLGQGLSFPATSLAVLATSSQEDQAVMTSTLILWRSLGIVMGVSFSSLILQNALTEYLEQLVTGHNKAKVIQRVRKSVRSIIDLDPEHQSQVIDAYMQSLRLVFISAMAMFVVVNILVFAIELPHLKKRKRNDDDGMENGS
ncbi:MFS general substrate transporter [Cucurbitaria berberidis CBS 394.84]|uniref:MFS general substrate transporter n=1 Tax=Cucurbitaria berberidis CBS 394.84 TaxID=1168544 RepID=A0A9P4GJU9_9PLEO|nr:MFS general substrate transporter [Cucurbitaria berberidis CBS 394.84]KAF1846764.1 MFS general substrate transporter [Cucurbitaria berberidis CBS 394.84]